jgi:hypothetical protein
MRSLNVVLCVACLVVVVGMFVQQRDSRGTEVIAERGLRIAAPYQHGNLAIFPVISDVPRRSDRFITLDEGLEAGTVEIYEIGADGNRVGNLAVANPPGGAAENAGAAAAIAPPPSGDSPPGGGNPGGNDVPVAGNAADSVQQLPVEAVAQPPELPQPPDQVAWNFHAGTGPEVNRLMVVNRSGKPLYLMPGEVIVGGQQDRTIAEETILVSTGEPTPIDVFCVEHGRWSDRDEQEAAEILSAVAEPRDGTATEQDTALSLAVQQANSGKFVASAGVLSKASRLATQATKDQSEVWDAVSRANAASGVAPASGAFTANYADPVNRRRLEVYIERLERRLSAEPDIVGVVVAINGKVEAVDVFESTPLFQKLWPKLLKSYALDATVQSDSRQPALPPRGSDAEDFLAKALTGGVQDESHGQGGLIVQRRSAEGVISFTAGETLLGTDGVDATASPAGLGGYGGGIHTSALAH